MAKELLLVLYSRPGCHLCEVAKEALQPVLRRYRVRLEERNVENDPAWERDYGHQVPVGMIGDRKLFKYRIENSDKVKVASDTQKALNYLKGLVAASGISPAPHMMA